MLAKAAYQSLNGGLTHRFREQARSHTSPFPQALGHELLRVMASYLAVVQFA
ncbi:hypothetical protein GCM10009091_12030 [Pseudomonas brenneri]|nr:hypothetical protein GCM10009091_12030 [Pseudomonas brenneri]